MSRTLARDSEEGQAWLAERPELKDLGRIDPPVVIAVDGEVVQLR